MPRTPSKWVRLFDKEEGFQTKVGVWESGQLSTKPRWIKLETLLAAPKRHDAKAKDMLHRQWMVKGDRRHRRKKASLSEHYRGSLFYRGKR